MSEVLVLPVEPTGETTAPPASPAVSTTTSVLTSNEPAVLLPAGRYPAPPTVRQRRLIQLAVAVLAAAGLLVVIRLGIAASGDGITQRSVGYTVTGPELTSVTFEVSRPTGTTVECSVRALSESWAEVGVATVTVEPSSSTTTRVSTDIPTSELAVAAEVVNCEAV